MMEMSPSFDALAKALPGAQAKFAKVAKDAANPHFNARYATLSEIIDATLPALNAAGITVLQPATTTAEGVEVTTVLMHDSGQWFAATHLVPITKRDAQGVGSTLTYARRQALQSMLTVAPQGEDDDAEGAAGRGQGRPPLPPPLPPQKPDRATRVARLEATMRDVKTLRDLTRAHDLAKDLRMELAAEEPATAARLDDLFNTRHAELLQGAG
jgi:hypothetical protein